MTTARFRAALLPILAPLLLAGLAAPLAADEPDPPEQTSGAVARLTAAALADTATAGPWHLREAIEVEDRLAALADSLQADGYEIEEIAAMQQAVRDTIVARLQRLEAAGVSIWQDLKNTASGGVQATVTKVAYKGALSNTLPVAGGGIVNDNLTWGYDTYRRQVKTVESRAANGQYDSGESLPFKLKAQASVDWVEDLTTNAGGNTNVNRRQTRRAGVSAGKTEIATGPLTHNLQADWYLYELQAVNQRQRNDRQEGELSGAVRSGMGLAEGVRLSTRLYRTRHSGENMLADLTNPSSTTGDTLGAGVFYDRSPLQGQFVITRSAFDKAYLDFRRNSNGLIDTTNLPDGVSKIVQELEEQDALTINWNNTVKRGRFQIAARLRHSVESQQYAASLVGRRERSSDGLDLQLLAPVGRDSFALSYKYDWSWDDQRFAAATSNRGRQYRKRRDLSLDWQRRLFPHTIISGRYRTELTQDIAEDMFNENDRDRLTEEGRLKLEAFWRQRFRANLLAEYQSIHDLSIRASRSANNNSRRTFEISPGYRYFLRPGLELAQTFRMYIQFQDYDYGQLETVAKDDSFNKRGSLATNFRIQPTPRLDVSITHDYSQRYNGTRTVRDAAGNTFYRRDQDQTISRIELGFTWTAVAWSAREFLKLQMATYRTRDAVERFGAASSTLTEKYSGEIWLGAVFNRRWGSPDRPASIDASVRRYLAYGPNVTETNRDYWQADASLKFTF